MIEILKPIYEAALFVERRNSHAGQIIPLFQVIKLDLIDQPNTEHYEDVRKAIVDGLENRLKGVLNCVILWTLCLDWQNNRLLTFPNILDPSFKLSLLPESRWESYKNQIISELMNGDGTSELQSTSDLPPQAANPFARLMNSASFIPPEQMDQKLKLEAVNYALSLR